jgi:predicted ATPase
MAGLQQLETLTGGHEITYYSAMGAVFRGWCLAALGQQQEGIAHIKQGIAANRAMGTLVYLPSFLKYLAEAYGMARRPEEGLDALAEAAAIVAAAQARQDEAEIHRVRGELLAATGNLDAAEGDFLAALAAARRQSARLLELRAAVSLARFWRERGNKAVARDCLAPVYHWFTEGHDTAALAEAKALLDTLV